MKISNGSTAEIVIAIFLLSSVLINKDNNYIWNIFAGGSGLIILIHSIYLLQRKRKKINNNTKNKYSLKQIIKNLNYEIIEEFKKNDIKFYDMMIVETNISIISAFYYIYIGTETKEEIIKYILEYTNSLKKYLSIKEIEERKINIINNKIYIEEELIKKQETEELLNSLVQLIIEDCTNEKYDKYSNLAVNIHIILLKNIELLITN